MLSRLLPTRLRFIRKKVNIGNGSSISRYSDVEGKYPVTVGKHTSIASHVVLKENNGPIIIGDKCTADSFTIIRGPVTIGNHVLIAGQVDIISNNHNYMSKTQLIRKQGVSCKGITIEDDVWVGAGVKILDGSHIKKGCVIGAGALVKGVLEPYGVYVGDLPHMMVPVRELVTGLVSMR